MLQGILWLILLQFSFGLWNREALLGALLHRWLSVFSASFAFSCTVPNGLSPSPLRATSVMRDDLLYHFFFMSLNICRALYNYAFVSLHEHYPILANSCFHYKWAFAGHHYVCVSAIKKRKNRDIMTGSGRGSSSTMTRDGKTEKRDRQRKG
jgi:hypothetical protein